MSVISPLISGYLPFCELNHHLHCPTATCSSSSTAIMFLFLFMLKSEISVYSDEKGKFDEVVEDKGVKVLIDPKALMHVIGTKMDYVDDPLRFMICAQHFLLSTYYLLSLPYGGFSCRSEFVFINPNSKGECGCGESFMTTSSKGSTSWITDSDGGSTWGKQS